MFEKRDYPILEFDPNPHAKLNPASVLDEKRIPENCVITFFGNVISDLLSEDRLTQVGTLYCATINLPIYEMKCGEKSIAIVQGFIGAAGSAAFLEELIALGAKKFIVCGAAGVLQKGIQVGHLIVPNLAVRDEGVSYHYLKPSREVECSAHALAVIEQSLQEDNIP